MLKKLFQKLESRFYEELNQKTSWGRNEIKEVFQKVLMEVLFDAVKGE